MKFPNAGLRLELHYQVLLGCGFTAILWSLIAALAALMLQFLQSLQVTSWGVVVASAAVIDTLGFPVESGFLALKSASYL